jgi:hypothetical protein
MSRWSQNSNKCIIAALKKSRKYTIVFSNVLDRSVGFICFRRFIFNGDGKVLDFLSLYDQRFLRICRD